MSKIELEELKKSTLSIDKRLCSGDEKGLIHVDGKKEFAFDEERKLMVIDTFGTADEDRFWTRRNFRRADTLREAKNLLDSITDRLVTMKSS